MPRGNGEKRVSLSGVTLPPGQMDRLERESEERTLGKSALVEKGLNLLFAQLDADAAARVAPKQGPQGTAP